MPFVRIAGYLEAMGLNAPRIIEADPERGFLLLTDLGDTQYLEHLELSPTDADALYCDALDALATLQSRGVAYQSLLPPYDRELLTFELSLFHDWFCEKQLGLRLSAAEEQQWQQACALLVENALVQPQTFVHRDYHSRNLMFAHGRKPGILDFQDAVEGPFTYDLVSLLKDCYIKWPQEDVSARASLFYAQLSDELRANVKPEKFVRYFDLMGVQRHLKAAGIFARLNRRDGKPGYLADIPRTLSYIVELESTYEELGFLAGFIRERCLSQPGGVT